MTGVPKRFNGVALVCFQSLYMSTSATRRSRSFDESKANRNTTDTHGIFKTLYEYLQALREDIPDWLDQFRDGDNFSHREFFGSRIVYYPGSGTDGHPVKVFGSTHSAHTFVFADYGVTQADLERELNHGRHGFRGYHTLARLHLQEIDVVPRGWNPHLHLGKAAQDRYQLSAPFGFLEILERDDEFQDNHGARRLAILFLGNDGIAAYDALFCQGRDTSVPFAIVLQDHGFGGNYDSFGGGSLLERIARDCHVVPRRLLVAKNTKPWDAFDEVPDVDGDPGGMHSHLRFLYERRET